MNRKADILMIGLQVFLLFIGIFGVLQGFNYLTGKETILDKIAAENIGNSDEKYISLSDSQDTQRNSDRKPVFYSAYASSFGTIGVAISTRVGIAFEDGMKPGISDGFYEEITFIGETSEEKKVIRENLIRKNMMIIREYLNLSRTDINALLDSSSNREATLESYISQLEIRFRNSARSINSLEGQKALLLREIERVEGLIDTTKTSMETNFSESRVEETLANVDTYYDLRQRYTEAFTDIVFINQFLEQHRFLNSYNAGILDTLILNKQALIDESFVIVPDTGDQYLEPLNLLIEEQDFKNASNSQNENN